MKRWLASYLKSSCNIPEVIYSRRKAGHPQFPSSDSRATGYKGGREKFSELYS